MKHIRAILALLLSALLMTCAMAEDADPAAAYEAAMALYEAEDFEQAISAFEALGAYKDSQKMLANSKWYWKEQRYDSAVALYKAESYAEAKALFEELGSFEESKSYLRKCDSAMTAQTYDQAQSLYEAGELAAAREIFVSLGDYKSSESRIAEIDERVAAQEQAAYEQECYEKAVALRAEGKLEEARDLFVLSGDTQDATQQIHEILAVLSLDEVYERAVMELGYGHYEEAIVRFELLDGHLDSAEQAVKAREALLKEQYEAAVSAEAENAVKAWLMYRAMGEYDDCAARAESLAGDYGIVEYYTAAEELRRADQFTAAAMGYSLCEGYKDSVERAKEMEENAVNSAAFERAHILTDLWRLEEANEIYESLGNYSYARRMGIGRITAGQLRDDATTDFSEIFTAPDGSTHRYRIFKGVHRWVEAEAFCRALGGHLATLTSEEENQFVHSFMRGSGNTTAYFGLVDEERDHVWEWVTGEPVEYLNWDSGEPSYSGRERYGMYFYKHIQGTWNDSHFYEDDEVDPGCSFICEWD